jgi:DNA-binding transcriptional regulator YdaS (Cro superfamily)
MGGQLALADALGVTQPAVSHWVVRGFAPLERIPEIAELTGVERRRLCDPRILDVIDP